MSRRKVRPISATAALWFGLTACSLAPVQVEPGGPSQAHHAVIIGRCVAAEDGRPLPGCEIFLNEVIINGSVCLTDDAFAFEEVYRFEFELETEPLSPSQDAELEKNWVRPHHLDRHFLQKPELDALRAQGKLYQKPPTAITDADGRFRIEFPVEDESLHCLYRLFTWSPLRMPWTDASGSPGEGETRDLGTLRLRLGQRVQGTVATADGTGIAGLRVRIKGLATTASVAGGQFVFAKPIPPGDWTLRVGGEGIADRTLQMTVGPRPWSSDILVEQPR